MSTTAEQSHLDVLVVDDQKNWRDTLVTDLLDEFKVKSVASYSEARRVVLDEHPPVVIADIRLDDADEANEDGLKLLEQIRELGEGTNVIVVTGYPTIATVRKALQDFRAFDYIEKYPASPFDRIGFKSAVRNAFADAQRRRPTSLTERVGRVIVVDDDPAWRHTVAGILEQGGFVVEIATTATAEPKLKAESFSLIVTDAKLLNERPELLHQIERSSPQARVVITVTEKEEWVQVITKPSISGVFRKGERFNPDDFRWTIERALNPTATKWVVAELSTPGVRDFLQVGKPYQFTLTLQDQKTALEDRDAVSIWLPPAEPVTLTVNLYARDIEVLPGASRNWDIPSKDKPAPLEFKLVPRSAGVKKIYVDLSYSGTRWLQRLEKEVHVVEEISLAEQ